MMKMGLLICALSASTVAYAQDSGTLVSLTPAQIEAAKEAGAAQNAHAASLGQEPVRDRAVHGEVGVSIGTGGYSSIYGTAVAPLGDSGVVAISVAQERYGRGYYRRR